MSALIPITDMARSEVTATIFQTADRARERLRNKVPGYSPYSGGDFVFRSARSCQMKTSWRRGNLSVFRGCMVLPVWIEHTTSPLPRECSTTELRQRSGGSQRGRGGENCHGALC